mmetsp:Transcript_63779/g.152082  ORF Transcript_63779/g.152082 Transcript_63779/m.152082 type:complete len:238 (-) Transcript_63779:248-961(-)
MGDQASTDNLTNQCSQVWCNQIHFGLQVSIQSSFHVRQLDHLPCKVVNVLHVHLHNVLAHGRFHRLENLICNVLRSTSFCKLVSALLIEAITNAYHPRNFCIRDVVGDDFGDLREMPGIPLPHSHCESVDVFVKIVQQRNCVDDRLILTIGVELHLASAVAVSQAKTSLVHIDFSQALDELVKVCAATPESLSHQLAMGDAELLRKGFPQLRIIHSKLVLLLGLWQVHLQEVCQHFC